MNTSKAGIALAKSALAFAQDHIGIYSAPDPGLNYAYALFETMMQFVKACPLPLENTALDKVGIFFDITIGRLIKSGDMGWFDEEVRRPFVLDCVDHLGAAAFNAAQRNGAVVTAAHLEAAACSMVQAKIHECPLKTTTSPIGLLGSCCMVLASEIGCDLKEMRAPAVPGAN
jgi:hypothetical protein